ncbi:Uncharacterised protein [Yersinia enterocolitica]|nr:hypothetical protein CH47_3580 [Yersinia enterocolitica]EKA25828.1 hypothetical protein YWA314_17484 [Yersinia enterocolitica subsp. enterocolitica WA-314]VTP85111.1 Uncharacterised protein [Yersinia enterocolitica subsp. enterocolitica]AJJ21593.1 hypothetical protein CH49_3612 [Yersinia enterocolitica]KGA69275.1 hypothetical protein DJ59_2571 [Yersinia enterocolitica]
MRHSSTQYIDIEPPPDKCVIKQQEEGGTRLERVSVDIRFVFIAGFAASTEQEGKPALLHLRLARNIALRVNRLRLSG